MVHAAPSVRSVTGNRRAALLRVAAGLIAESGYAGTSLRDVADAAGIQPGSFYHHFDSKESLAVELVHAFQADLEALAAEPVPGDPLSAVRRFAERAAEVADRHRAAVYLCMYDPPTATGEELRTAVRLVPSAYDARWRSLLGAAASAGALHPDTDLVQLRVVLRDAVTELGRLPGAAASSSAAVDTLTSLLLDGVAPAAPPDALLDSSAAAAVVADLVAGWAGAGTGTPPRRGQILDAARIEFARRGYEATTVREIAEAAGVRASSMYRHFDSKQAMLSAIMESFSQQLLAAYRAVTEASTSATEALDGLLHLMCSATGFFRSEFTIMRDWWQTVGEGDPQLRENVARFELLRQVVADGVQDGSFIAPRHQGVFTYVLRDVMWFQAQDLAAVPDPERLAFLRRTVLRGAARCGPVVKDASLSRGSQG